MRLWNSYATGTERSMIFAIVSIDRTRNGVRHRPE
ncbi:hypothetical protein L485_00035 [Sphingobium baderi LL03]|uniref:Uncharacterized protein n=1 Tax=Sphingobium baderi LL03 TaxID=1114964 RepID=T0H2C3_9SPHN|nr:hypothetical protein L485_00035 [Sphingobium baderi LL03]